MIGTDGTAIGTGGTAIGTGGTAIGTGGTASNNRGRPRFDVFHHVTVTVAPVQICSVLKTRDVFTPFFFFTL